ncbi:body protein 6 [Seminavis robusta]|uniref:Body protein 6 n=1 Tax=Seminavis robusta TaxID=568900 RepID=A0A9N8HS54_9STRA|nr:body protein 6 [Seminavis robusta]|eukprot:Sro1479_g276110.1 body protein 6 (226) ;mRNA; r:26716-27393
MGGAFSSSSKSTTNKKSIAQSQVTDVDRAILDLKNARDRLTKYNASLETSIEKLVERAKAAKEAGRTQTALGLLRLKKYKQAQVESCQTQLLNVHQMIETIDSQQRNAQLVESMKAGKDALAKLHAETTVDDVLNLMDEISEQHGVEQEITDVINGAVPSLTADQEEAVEAELAALEAELAGTTPTTTTTTEKLDLPIAPGDALPEIKQPVAEAKKQPERVPIAG